MPRRSNHSPSLPQSLLLGFIHAYQITSRLFTPLTATLFPVSACRFTPTCSQYALQAIARLGVFKGLYLTLKRLSRCHPNHPGGFDPVPF